MNISHYEGKIVLKNYSFSLDFLTNNPNFSYNYIAMYCLSALIFACGFRIQIIEHKASK